MRTLIIPDLHHKMDNADYWLRTQEYDRAIFLGDFFDDYGDDVCHAQATATWVRKRIETTEDVFLLGNHDLPYRFPDMLAAFCPGFTQPKAWGINQIFTPEHWQRFRVAHLEQGFLFSHAGFHPYWAEGLSHEELLARGEQALEKAAQDEFDSLLGAGLDRGGNHVIGGPLWLDWETFQPVPGLNQIVGHSPGAEVREKHGKESRNYCLDVGHGSASAIVEDGDVTFEQRLPRRR